MALLLRRSGLLLGVRLGGVAPSRPSRSLTASVPRAAGEAAAPAKPKEKVVGKAVLAKRLAEEQKITEKAALEIIDSLLDDIMLTVAEGQAVTIPGFGSWKKRHRPERKGRNPASGAEILIPAKDAPTFSAGSAFKGVVEAGSWEAYDAVALAKKEAAAAKKKK